MITSPLVTAILHACTIESNAFIGIASTILDKAVARSYAMLGANTPVTGKQIITGKTLWLGQPATAKRPLTNDTLSYIDYSAQHYQRIAWHNINHHNAKHSIFCFSYIETACLPQLSLTFLKDIVSILRLFGITLGNLSKPTPRK